MIIRHITIPGQSHLLTLRTPSQKEEGEQVVDRSYTMKRILNPEQPSRDGLASLTQHHLNVLHSLNKQPQIITKVQQEGLAIELPQKLEILPNTTNLTHPLTTKHEEKESWQKYKRERQAIPHRDMTLTPNPRLIKHNYRAFAHRSNSTNNKLELVNDLGQEEQDALKKNTHSLNKQGKTLYSAGEILFNKKTHRLLEGQSTHNILTSSPYKAYNLMAEVSKPQQKYSKDKQLQNYSFSPIQDIISNRPKHIEHNIPSIKPTRNKRILPAESDVDQDSFNFNTTQQRQYRHRPSEEQESTLSAKPESEMMLSNKKHKPPRQPSRQPHRTKPIQISYKTTLQQLKQISLLPNLSASDVTMKIPEIFAYPLFSGKQSQQQLFDKVDELFKHLQIDANAQKSIKKYANCIVILTGSVGLIWHFEGKVFLGGWKNEFLDQGCKHGLGLEWKPKQYAYYGQFARNKKEGVGIMKTQRNQLLAGVWEDNHYLHPLSTDSNRQPHRLQPIVSHFAFEESS